MEDKNATSIPKVDTPTAVRSELIDSYGPISVKLSEIQTAIDIAKTRERFRWEVGYTLLLAAGSSLYWGISRKFPAPMLFPLSISTILSLHDYDKGYGTQMQRVQVESFKILRDESYKYFKRT